MSPAVLTSLLWMRLADQLSCPSSWVYNNQPMEVRLYPCPLSGGLCVRLYPCLLADSFLTPLEFLSSNEGVVTYWKAPCTLCTNWSSLGLHMVDSIIVLSVILSDRPEEATVVPCDCYFKSRCLLFKLVIGCSVVSSEAFTFGGTGNTAGSGSSSSAPWLTAAHVQSGVTGDFVFLAAQSETPAALLECLLPLVLFTSPSLPACSVP